MSDDRPKKSWRDIDKMRDKSTHRRDERGGGGPSRGPRGQRSYRAALDRLFESGKIADLVEQRAPGAADDSADDESRLKMLAKIKQATGRDAITKAVDAYLDTYELPEDHEVLAQVLEHRDPERQQLAMERIAALLETKRPRRCRGIIGQLKLIRDMDYDREMTRLAEDLIERLEAMC